MAEKMTLERATELLQGQGFHCSQAVMVHVAEVLNLDKDLLVKMVGGLGGGCFHGDVCGCVSAAIMGIDAIYGYNTPHASEQNAIMIQKLTKFEQKFIEKYGSIVCKDLLGGYSFADPEQAKKIFAEGLVKDCPNKVVYACELFDEIIAEG